MPASRRPFAALADKKLKPGGVLALVLPLSAAAGLSWQKFRHMLAADYTDLTVLTIAAADNDDLSFSADTGLAECLVIARKLKRREQPSPRAHFTSLTRRPQGFAHAGAIAGNVASANGVRQVEDGPYGGTPLTVGAELAGQMMTVPNDTESTVWGAVRLADYSLAQTAHALASSRLWPPGSPAALDLNVASLGSVGKLGLVHRDIIGPNPRVGLLTKHRLTRRLPIPRCGITMPKMKRGWYAFRLRIAGASRHGRESRDDCCNCQSCPCDSRLPIQFAASCCCLH